MKIFKKIGSFLLVIIMAINMVPVDSYAKSTVSKGKPTITVSKAPADLIVLKKGNKFNLKASIEAKAVRNKRLKYQSSDTRIAIVSPSGKITALRNGTAKVIIRSAADSNVKKTISVKVGKPVNKVSLGSKKISLQVNDTYKLKVTVSPAKATYKKVAYSSSNNKIVKVSNKGVVTALKEGKATISVVSLDGSNKKASLQVTVTKKAGASKITEIQEPSPVNTARPTVGPSAFPTAVRPEDNYMPRESAKPSASPISTVTAIETSVPSEELTPAQTKAPAVTPTKAPAVKPTATPASVPTATVDPLFDVPYVSTYYFNPKPSVEDKIEIPLYITDSRQSEYLDNDVNARIDLIYTVDGTTKEIKNLPLGDYTLELGRLSEGKHIFSVQTRDNRTGMKSHELFNDLWVINHKNYDITDEQTYVMTEDDLNAYSINNKNSADKNDLESTRDGLNALFANLHEAGYRKCVMLEGIYRINGENTSFDAHNYISIPTDFTVDMNNSTFKLNTITSENGGCIVKFHGTVDSHLINGTLEGDRIERQKLDLETGFLGEKNMTVVMEGDKYSSLNNLTIKNTTGHTVGCGCYWGPRLAITSYSPTAIIDGKEVPKTNCSTSDMMDLTPIIEWDDTEDYIYVGHPEGYRGLMGDSEIIYVSFYNSDRKYIKTVTGYQYRKIAIPKGGKYARVTMLGNDIATTGYDGTVSIYTKRFETYGEITNVDFYDTRTTAIAPSAAMSLLIENCTFTRCGNSITPLCVDFEDGAQECQDMYYRNNTVLENGSTTCTVVSCFGYNHVIENCINHSIEIRAKVSGAVVRNIGDLGNVTWYLGERKQGSFGRLYNCGMHSIRIADNTASGKDGVKFKIYNCNIAASWLQAVAEKVTFDKCLLTELRGADATFNDCTIMSAFYLGNEMYFKGCTFKSATGADNYITFIQGGNKDKGLVREFDNCNFEGKTFLVGKDCFHSGTFRNCIFDDVGIVVGVENVESEVLFENCVMNSTAGDFIKVGPFAYSSDYINMTFKKCTITHIGERLIYMYAKPGKNSNILFDDCKIIKDSGKLVSWENGYNLTNLLDKVSVAVKFKKTNVNPELTIENINTDKFKVLFEN